MKIWESLKMLNMVKDRQKLLVNSKHEQKLGKYVQKI